MMKKRIIWIAVTILLIILAFAQTTLIQMATIVDCKLIEIIEPTFKTCTGTYQERVCDDDCHNETRTYEYPCIDKVVKNSKKVCEPKAFEINTKVGDQTTETQTINYADWGRCSYTKQTDGYEIICDSRFDGNNDGVCQPGESCIKFIVGKEGIKRLIKNSQETFSEDDPSFFLEKLEVES